MPPRRVLPPIKLNSKIPQCETFAAVVTVNTVLAAPFAVVTVAGLKLQVIPTIGGQENVTLLVNPPAGVTVNMN